MELKLNIEYPELLELIRQLPFKQLTQLQADLEVELEQKEGTEEALPVSNKEAVLSLAGSLSDEETTTIKKLINEEFETVEGEW